MDDVVIVGGGVIGLSIAFELAGQGVSVTLLEQGDFAREASWAGAGILPPGNLDAAETPEARLRSLSHSLWPSWAEALRGETGIDTGYRRCGGLEVRMRSDERAASGAFQREVEGWHAEQAAIEVLSVADALALEPELSPAIRDVYRLGHLGQVRNPRLVKALEAACAGRGVQMRAGTPVTGFERWHDHVTGVRTPGGVIQAGRYCLAGGAWSGMLASPLGLDVPILPIRGQMVLLSHVPPLFSHVIQVGSRYLVPRDDGRTLIGSTEERVGFAKANTARAVSGLIEFARELVPRLAEARFERAWSGLRPGSPDGLPYLGRVAGFDNLFVAAGHFRSGLQMSAGTGRLLRQAILEEETSISLEPFAVDRTADTARRSL